MVISEKNFLECLAANAHEQVRMYKIMISSGVVVDDGWEDCSEEHRESTRAGVRLIVNRLMDAADTGDVDSSVTVKMLHNSWMERKKANGWTYGPILDMEKKTHPCFLPYEMLSEEERMRDTVFLTAVLTWIGIFGLHIQSGE